MELRSQKTYELKGEIQSPASKSYTIRAVLSALMCDGFSKIKAPLQSRDAQAAYNTCELMGGKIKFYNDYIEVKGCSGKIKTPQITVDVMNSGTTLRLATAIASLGEDWIKFTGDKSIQARSIKALTDSLNQLGAKTKTQGGYPPHSVKGPLRGGECDIVGDISSQYISGLLMAAPYAKKDVIVNITTELKSKPYLMLTIDMLNKFGVTVINNNFKRLQVPAGQKYHATEYTVEGDYSSAAFILAASALTKSDVTVKNIFRDSLQADKKIVEIIGKMGAKVYIGDDYVNVKSTGRLNGCVVDLSDSPDLVPIASVLGALSKGEFEIVNTEHARFKECDRISAMTKELGKMGADITEKRDGLKIVSNELSGASLDGWNDHRIIMSLAVAGLMCRGETIVSDAEHMDVTYPNFQKDMEKLGAKIQII